MLGREILLILAETPCRTTAALTRLATLQKINTAAKRHPALLHNQLGECQWLLCHFRGQARRLLVRMAQMKLRYLHSKPFQTGRDLQEGRV